MDIKKFILTWGMLISTVLLNSFSALVLKHQINKIGNVPFDSFSSFSNYFLSLLKSPLAVMAFIAMFLSAFVWMATLSRMEISTAYPVNVGLNFLIVIVAGFMLFNETISVFKIIGIVLIFVSIILLSLK